LALNGTVAAQRQERFPDTPSNPRRLTADPCNKVTTTGTVKLRAVFDNREEVLFPNQFVNVRLLIDTMRDTDIVPVSAIQRGAPGTFVYLVNPENTVTVAKVKHGPGDGQNIAILSGLQPGESVVVDGADRLRDGAKVTLAAKSKTDGAAPGAQRAEGQLQAAARQSAPRRAEP